MLAEEVEIAVRQRIPTSCAIVGSAGGNAFEELAVAGVRRIVGIDINPAWSPPPRRGTRTLPSGKRFEILTLARRPG